MNGTIDIDNAIDSAATEYPALAQLLAATTTRTGGRITPLRMPPCTRSRMTRHPTPLPTPRATSTGCSARDSTTTD